MSEEWRDQAACKNHDIRYWYPSVVRVEDPELKPRRETQKLYRKGRRICSGCEVRVECLEHALVNKEPFGMWGGLTRPERVALARETK